MSEAPRETEEQDPPEENPGEVGAEGGADSEAADALPGEPAGDDSSPLGDTDQHSQG